jgi:hypothetical protein
MSLGRTLPACLIAAVASAACTGRILGSSSSGTSSTTQSCTPGFSDAPLRRLSRTEYLATAADLFPAAADAGLLISNDQTDQGFENRATLLNPSPLLIEQYSTAAAALAATVMANPAPVLPCATQSGSDPTSCTILFLQTMGRSVFRRPLTPDEMTTYAGFAAEERDAGADLVGSVQLTLEAMLQAPAFMYRLEFGQPDPAAAGQSQLTPYELAARMSYLLWGSAPDPALLDQAAANQLQTPEQREAESRRMLADP